MTSSPGLLGWSRLQARSGVLQAPTDDDDRRRQTPASVASLAPTLCVRGSVIMQYTLIPAHWLHYVKKWCNPQNWKYMFITYCTVVIGGPIYSHIIMYKTFSWSLDMRIWRYASGQTDKYPNTLITILCTTAWSEITVHHQKITSMTSTVVDIAA